MEIVMVLFIFPGSEITVRGLLYSYFTLLRLPRSNTIPASLWRYQSDYNIYISTHGAGVSIIGIREITHCSHVTLGYSGIRGHADRVCAIVPL